MSPTKDMAVQCFAETARAACWLPCTMATAWYQENHQRGFDAITCDGEQAGGQITVPYAIVWGYDGWCGAVQ